MLKKRGDLVSIARVMYDMPREDEACANVCRCDRTPLLKKTVINLLWMTFVLIYIDNFVYIADKALKFLFRRQKRVQFCEFYRYY